MGNDEVRISRRCEQCGTELKKSDKKCPKCGSTSMYAVQAGGTLYPRGSLRARQKRKGFNKFVKEVIQGWVASINPKLSKGVEKQRTIDRERDRYDEVVKDAKSGQIIHETHEPLSQHKHLPTGGS